VPKTPLLKFAISIFFSPMTDANSMLEVTVPTVARTAATSGPPPSSAAQHSTPAASPRGLLDAVRQFCVRARGPLLLFDSPETLSGRWGMRTAGEFFGRCCPMLLDLGAIAYWPVPGAAHYRPLHREAEQLLAVGALGELVERLHGQPAVDRRQMQALVQSQATFAGNAPWLLEDRLRLAGAIYEAGPAWMPHVVTDGNLITGQQWQSAESVVNVVLEKLKVAA